MQVGDKERPTALLDRIVTAVEEQRGADVTHAETAMMKTDLAEKLDYTFEEE